MMRPEDGGHTHEAPFTVEWLSEAASNTYSQFGEDGIIDAIFRTIGVANQVCFECGAADGIFFSNSRRLIESGWSAVLVEADQEQFARLTANCDGFGERVVCVRASVGVDLGLEEILDKVDAPQDIDLVVIDVDGQDYHLFNSILRYCPRVVVVEYDPLADEDFIPGIGADGQAGLRAVRKLAAGKYYVEVCRTRTNLIFVRHPIEKAFLGAAPILPTEGKMKLDLGAGDVSPPGFTPMGNAHGSEIYPLSGIPDGSCEVVRASHCLEHFPFAEIPAVLAEWARVLKPGGTLKVAVPDFSKVAQAYLAGADQPTEMFVMGGQTEADDFHKALFDVGRLGAALAGAGLMLVRPWESELPDCAAYPISLNLEATKPHTPQVKVSAIMSVPRLGFMDNMGCAIEALPQLNVKFRRAFGVYWGQCLERAIEETLRDDAPDAVLALDYDSVFTTRDVATLIQLMCCHPDAHAIAAVQAGRTQAADRLFTIKSPDGKSNMLDVPTAIFADDLTPVSTAHFGLTLIQADRLAAMPKPWFSEAPAPDGSWNEGRVDADIGFWRKWEAAGNDLFLANRVPIGHLELAVLWPAATGLQTTPIAQSAADWRRVGKPAGAWE